MIDGIEAYHRPRSVAEALELARRPGAVFLAGGTEVNRSDFPRPVRELVDLQALGLGGIGRQDGDWRIGATTVLQDVVDAAELPAPLREAAGAVPSRNVRNAATLGGQVAFRRSADELLPVLVALRARVELARSRDGEVRRELLPLEDVLELDGDEPALLLAVLVPAEPRPLAREVFRRSAGDLPLLSAALSCAPGDGPLREPVLVLGGIGLELGRLRPVEQRLEGALHPDPEELVGQVESLLAPRPDFRGSSAFKARVAGVLAARLLSRVLAARGGAS